MSRQYVTGRKQDIVWENYEKLTVPGKTGCRAKCKVCKKEMQGLVSRMKTHQQQCQQTTETGKCSTTTRDCEFSDIEEDVAIIENDELISNPVADTAINNSDVEKDEVDQQCDNSMPSIKYSSTSQKQTKMSSFTVKTTKAQKRKLDSQVARFIFGTNSSFSNVEHPEFISLVGMLRPGYKPPNRIEIGSTLLDSAYDAALEEYHETLKGKTVCMSLDGWSNIRNEPVIGITVTSADNIYLMDTVDTSGDQHTAEYLSGVARKTIKNCQTKYECIVGSFVTDNAANVRKMRQELLKTNDDGINANLITYGCSAHILNLLAKDVKIQGVKGKVLEIIKYFRNNHFASAKLRCSGGKALIMPIEVRWSSMADCFQSYLENWSVMMKVCEENRSQIDQQVANNIKNFVLKRSIEEALAILLPIAMACDKAQKDNCLISDVVEIWQVLIQQMTEMCIEMDLNQRNKDTIMNAVNSRYEMAMTPAHYLANILNPKYCGKSLSDDELDEAMAFAAAIGKDFRNTVINYRAKSSPFLNFMFDCFNEESKDKDQTNGTTPTPVTPLSWWLSYGNRVSQDALKYITQLHTATASTAGLERMFSTFGIIHTKLRNRLGIEKCGKLVSVFKVLNKKKTKKRQKKKRKLP